tara:strand:- start:932 stop:1177 length:246 start_codon:yes stop_codon:yes gene_type:complete
MTSFVQAARRGRVLVTFKHIKTGEELQRNVTLYPHLIPHGFKVGNIDSKCMKIPMWDMDNQVWMDLERSTIINYIPQYKRS